MVKMVVRWGVVLLLTGALFAGWQGNHGAPPSTQASNAKLAGEQDSAQGFGRHASKPPATGQRAYRPSTTGSGRVAKAGSAPSWTWGVQADDWKSLYAAWSNWRRTQGPGLDSAREYVAYLASTGRLSDANGDALVPAAQAGDWEVLMLALARLAPHETVPDEVARFDGFMRDTLGQCGASGGDLSPACSNTAFLGALNALAPGLSRNFVVRVVDDAGECGLPMGESLRPSIEKVLQAERTTPWCR